MTILDKIHTLREKTGCGIMGAKDALEARDFNLELAEEYLQRRGLAAVMPDDMRYPKWYAAGYGVKK